MTDLDHILSGRSFPLGATTCQLGVNFSVYSKHAARVDLLFFDDVEDDKPAWIIELDPIKNRTFHYWHTCVPGIQSGQLYGYQVYGPYLPELGHRYNNDQLLIDPYGRSVAIPSTYDRKARAHPGSGTAGSMKSVFVDTQVYDWEEDRPLHRPFNQTVIYEMHVGGFTRNPNSGIDPAKRGTYAGLIEKIPYLQDLGITAVELLPVFQFDEQEAPNVLTNYWGYNPVSFFAPHLGYSSTRDPLGPLNEFRDMVKALHKAGIEVILDVVYNHTAEGDQTGPTFCFRGFENRAYYILGKDRSQYENFSGTGNTLNSNHAIVRRLILDSLRYWVQEMHVDGFRFDLASILSRDQKGVPLVNPPVIWDIETDPVLAGTKLIAEAWDAGGLYQVGTFIGDRWKEWNGRFRDDVRSFVKSDPGMISKLASRFLASPDLYAHEDREPEQSINFITCHDGFTLNDLVSYNHKHNWANKEGNRDGHNHNLSWNCGVEGPTDNPEIERLRKKQIKNFLAINLLALGVPMLLMGDEVRRSQMGNNNAYCQDNEISWFDWSLLNKHADIHRFVKELIRYRLSLGVYKDIRGISLTQLLQTAQLDWHGIKLHEPDLEYDSHSLAFSVRGRRGLFHVIFNAYWKMLEFEIPPTTEQGLIPWRKIIDTSQDSPEDFCEIETAPQVLSNNLFVAERSVVVLVANLKK
jgi:glycogen operon protein